jgi:hypothetical protein
MCGREETSFSTGTCGEFLAFPKIRKGLHENHTPGHLAGWKREKAHSSEPEHGNWQKLKSGRSRMMLVMELQTLF